MKVQFKNTNLTANNNYSQAKEKSTNSTEKMNNLRSIKNSNQIKFTGIGDFLERMQGKRIANKIIKSNKGESLKNQIRLLNIALKDAKDDLEKNVHINYSKGKISVYEKKLKKMGVKE